MSINNRIYVGHYPTVTGILAAISLLNSVDLDCGPDHDSVMKCIGPLADNLNLARLKNGPGFRALDFDGCAIFLNPDLTRPDEEEFCVFGNVIPEYDEYNDRDELWPGNTLLYIVNKVLEGDEFTDEYAEEIRRLLPGYENPEDVNS